MTKAEMIAECESLDKELIPLAEHIHRMFIDHVVPLAFPSMIDTMLDGLWGIRAHWIEEAQKELDHEQKHTPVPGAFQDLQEPPPQGQEGN